ncbi:hypothetical protein BD779DRAFT_1519624 [Infundibulicybe gibba]|nr:hypothetical protein BD779DRAFT_1519624 [Infundibulicybe gibba]
MLDTNPEAYYTNCTLPQMVDATQYLSTEDRALLDGAHDSPEDAPDSRGWHLERMSAFAAQYVRRLSQIKSCYLGQILFKCCGDGKVTSTGMDRGDSWLQLEELWERVVGFPAYF